MLKHYFKIVLGDLLNFFLKVMHCLPSFRHVVKDNCDAINESHYIRAEFEYIIMLTRYIMLASVHHGESVAQCDPSFKPSLNSYASVSSLLSRLHISIYVKIRSLGAGGAALLETVHLL